MTAEQKTGRIGVQAAPISQAIHGGPLNAAGTLFLSKQDVTDMALRAVADYVWRHFDGKVEMLFSDGVAMTVEVAR